MAEQPKGNRKARSTGEIQADIEETRARLVDNLDRLKAETAPPVLVAKAKAKVHDAVFDPQTGLIRKERVVAVAVGVLGIVILRRGLKVRARRRELARLREVVWVPVPRSAVTPEVAKVARQASELGGPAVVVSEDVLQSGNVPLALQAPR